MSHWRRKVHLAIVVQVGGDHPEAAAVAIDDTRLLRHIDESARVIAEQVVGQSLRTERIAVEVAIVGRVAAEPGILDIPGRVVANVEVKVAVTVQVSHRRRRGPIPVTTQSGAGRHVLEGSVALVAVKGIRPPARDEQVGAAVAVDVADRDAMAVPAGKRPIPEASVTSSKWPSPRL